MYVVIYQRLRPGSHIVEWVDWHDALISVSRIGVLGVLLALIPTLVMTRKYLRV
jgi:cell division transport system permease protein